MAQFVNRNPLSMIGILALIAVTTLIVYATATSTKLGGVLYLLCIGVIVLGFWAKEDTVAIGGVMAISFVVILDIMLHIGLLG